MKKAGIVLLMVLAGCSGPGKSLIFRDRINVCPPEKVEVHCPHLPKHGGMVLEEYLIESEYAHRQCEIALQAWEEAHAGCREATKD